MPGALQTVDLRELIPEIGGVAGGVEGAADGLKQGRGVLHAAVFPDLLLQPAVDPCQPAGGHGGGHVEVLLHLPQILGAVGRADGVGGEIADVAIGPVGILEDALPVVGHVHAQIRLVQAVPLGGQVVGRQLPGEHPPLQLIAHHDMQAVGQLVGLGADQGGLGLVDHAVKILQADVVQPGGEVLPEPGVDDPAEGPAAADDVLIEPGLAFVDGHGHAAAQAGAGQLPAHVQLIQGVAALVDHGVQGRGH